MKRSLLIFIALLLTCAALVTAQVQPFTGKLYSRDLAVYNGATLAFKVDHETGAVTITGAVSGTGLTIAQSAVTGLETALGLKAPAASPTFTGTLTLSSANGKILFTDTGSYMDAATLSLGSGGEVHAGCNISSGQLVSPSFHGMSGEGWGETYNPNVEVFAYVGTGGATTLHGAGAGNDPSIFTTRAVSGVDAGANSLTYTANASFVPLAVNDLVMFGGTDLPLNLLLLTDYYVKTAVGNTITISATLGGAEFDIADVGSGLIDVYGPYVYRAAVGVTIKGGDANTRNKNGSDVWIYGGHHNTTGDPGEVVIAADDGVTKIVDFTTAGGPTVFGNLVMDTAGATVDGVNLNTHAHTGSDGSAAISRGQVKTVGASGCQYTTIQAAVTAITDAATGNRYVVQVYPGTYTEHITGKDYVSIIGTDPATCIITEHDSTIVTLGSNCSFENLTVTELTGGVNPIIGIQATDDYTLVRNCTVNTNQWGIVPGGIADRVVGCRVNAPNPFMVGGTGVEISGCTCDYTTTAAVGFCVGAIDADGATDGLFVNNSFRIRYNYAGGSPGNDLYGIHCTGGGSTFANNEIDISGNRPNAHAIEVDPDSVLTPTTANRFTGNRIRIHSTSGAPAECVNIRIDRDSTANEVGDMWLMGNSLITSANSTPSSGYWLIDVTDNGVDITDATDLPIVEQTAITSDRASMGVGTADYGVNPHNVLVTWLPERGRPKVPTVEVWRNIADPGNDNVWSTANGQADINLATPTVTVMRTGGDWVRPQHQRMLFFGSTGNATIRVHSWDKGGWYSYEDVAVTSGGGGACLWPRYQLWYIELRTPGTGALTAGLGEGFGLTGDITANGDVTAWALETGGVRGVLADPATLNGIDPSINAVDLGFLYTAGDTVEIFYNGVAQ